MPILSKETSRHPAHVLSDEYSASADDRGCIWWAFFTKPRQEKSLARDLIARDIPFYLPLVKKQNLIRGRKVSSFLPLFPGYVFALTHDDGRIASLKTNRICMALPAPDSDGLRQDLIQLDQLIEADVPVTIESRLTPGQEVRVRRGALAGIQGVVVERRKKCRLLVSVQYLQCGVSLEIDDYMLEPL